MMINPEYAKPILKLANILVEKAVPLTIVTLWDGLQLRFSWNHGDVICHTGSLGHEYGYVESMGFPWDKDDVSCLRVEDMAQAIYEYWKE
jgi:hypothetical protein